MPTVLPQLQLNLDANAAVLGALASPSPPTCAGVDGLGPAGGPPGTSGTEAPVGCGVEGGQAVGQAATPCGPAPLTWGDPSFVPGVMAWVRDAAGHGTRTPVIVGADIVVRGHWCCVRAVCVCAVCVCRVCVPCVCGGSCLGGGGQRFDEFLVSHSSTLCLCAAGMQYHEHLIDILVDTLTALTDGPAPAPIIITYVQRFKRAKKCVGAGWGRLVSARWFAASC